MTPPNDVGRLSFTLVDARFLERTDQPGMIHVPYVVRIRWASLMESEGHLLQRAIGVTTHRCVCDDQNEVDQARAD